MDAPGNQQYLRGQDFKLNFWAVMLPNLAIRYVNFSSRTEDWQAGWAVLGVEKSTHLKVAMLEKQETRKHALIQDYRKRQSEGI